MCIWSILLIKSDFKWYKHLIRSLFLYWTIKWSIRDNLKLYCRYEYTKPWMINHSWGLKQLWLQVNGHAWFHLQRLRWPVRNGEGAKNSKWKYMSPAGFEPTPCQSTTGKSGRLRPLGHESLIVISGLMSYMIIGYKFYKKLLRDNTCQLDFGYMCIWTEYQTKLSFLILL